MRKPMLNPEDAKRIRNLGDLIDRLEADWAVALDYNRAALVGIDKQMMAVYEQMESIRKGSEAKRMQQIGRAIADVRLGTRLAEENHEGNK